MSTAEFDNFQAPGNRPAYFPYGFRVAAGYSNGINDIGVAGQRGFGVGICPGPLPSGMGAMAGYNDPASDNYGNYQYSDGSVMVWVPAFYYKYGTGANGLTLNTVNIKPFSEYTDVAAANAAGYALHRAFYDGGAVKDGFFFDKYITSNNGGIASSLKNGVVLASGQRGSLSSAVYSALTGAPANNLGGSFAAAKTRGANFFVASQFQRGALAILSLAHAQASTSTTYCAWYHATNNFPKGNNNNALGDAQDPAILYVADGNGTYPGCGKTGSANLFARTTHNGQNSGIADLNGIVWEFSPGLTSDGTNLYLLNTSVAMKSLTGGSGAATDAFGAAGIAANYTSIGATYQSLTKAGGWVTTGNVTNQVLSASTSGADWAMASMGIPLTGGMGGSNAFGNDGIYQPAAWPNEMAPASGGGWTDASLDGLWALDLYDVRAGSYYYIGFRSALYL